MSMTHTYTARIYYEDTDAGEIVYYANYLKFTERARTELLREIGFNSSASLSDGYGFVVANVNVTYKMPAKLDDMISVKTSVIQATKTRLLLKQDVYRNDTLLTESEVTLAYVDKAGRPVKIPEEIVNAMENFKNE